MVRSRDDVVKRRRYRMTGLLGGEGEITRGCDQEMVLLRGGVGRRLCDQKTVLPRDSAVKRLGCMFKELKVHSWECRICIVI